jgi:hypothetical protein
MTQKPPKFRAMYGSVLLGGALALPVIFYASGFPTVGGALLLSTVLIVGLAIIKSGALSISWISGETRGSIQNSTRHELAKAFICAALAVDVLSGGAQLLDHYRLWRHNISMTVLLTTTGLLAIAAGLYLTRWFAGYLSTRR